MKECKKISQTRPTLTFWFFRLRMDREFLFRKFFFFDSIKPKETRVKTPFQSHLLSPISNLVYFFSFTTQIRITNPPWFRLSSLSAYLPRTSSLGIRHGHEPNRKSINWYRIWFHWQDNQSIWLLTINRIAIKSGKEARTLFEQVL